ncbi:MAG: hypothetical protein N7Q72_04870, partial [Spiroplasma sp. Tabriz.8]|nr:hypothetical protein [Spiroplasma sp. Tabriz.8]
LLKFKPFLKKKEKVYLSNFILIYIYIIFIFYYYYYYYYYFIFYFYFILPVFGVGIWYFWRNCNLNVHWIMGLVFEGWS